ncbi:MAG TPA: sulfite exporter TauE/SafE family protein [Sedimentisphaerales bacterium]|nr:sulfite exporter TauE/SafE family protein [Sedimentisphaerales bacterium]
MLELDTTGWLVVSLCAVTVGIAKTGVPGVTILAVPSMVAVLPARSSVGVLLGMLILGDLFAAGYYRRHAQWRHVARLLPPAFIGIVAGYFLLRVVSDEQLKPIIGAIVLVMLAVNYWRTRPDKDAPVPTQWWFAATMGFLAGITTMMANAAGPVMVIYLLAMRLAKVEFVGTGAWFFFIINWVKVPFSANLQMMTAASVKLDLIMLPAIALGAVVGILLLKRIPQKLFTAAVQLLAAAAALKLLF